MNKKSFSAFSLLIICIILLVLSYSDWKSKISSYNDDVASDKPKNSQPVSPEKVNTEPKEETEKQSSTDSLFFLTKNQDERVQNVFQARFSKSEKVDFLIVGSDLMESGDPGYAKLLEKALIDNYGDSINVSIQSFDSTSLAFIDNIPDLSVGYDIILFEPFTLKNNGEVAIEDEHAHIEEFSAMLKDEVEDAVIVLNPANPIYAATYYPSQISALQEYASLNGIPYLDHWQNWPDTDSEDINQLLDESSAPNSEGAQVWADALITYFVAQ